MAVELFVYADESGIQDSAEYCLMAGYIGSPRIWAKFNQAWAETLAKYAVPEFHAIEFFPVNRRRHTAHYADWSTEKTTAFISELSTVIHRHSIDPVCGAVNVKAFNALSYGERRFITGGNITSAGKWLTQGAPTRPYRVAFFFLLRDAVPYAKRGDAIVHFVFDRQNLFEGGTLQEFDAIVRSGEGADKIIDTTKLGSLVFSDRKRDIQLQAADLLAHCWYTELTRGEHPTPERAMAMYVLSDKRRAIRVFEANGLDQFFLDGEKYGISRDMLRKMGPGGL